MVSSYFLELAEGNRGKHVKMARLQAVCARARVFAYVCVCMRKSVGCKYVSEVVRKCSARDTAQYTG